MSVYLLQENGSKLLVENASGFLILEASDVAPPTVNWQAGGAGYPVRTRRKRRETDQLFAAIEHSLDVALGLVQEPVARASEAAAAVPEAPKVWEGKALGEAVSRLEVLTRDYADDRERLHRIQRLLRAYEEAQHEAFLDEEETWLLMA